MESFSYKFRKIFQDNSSTIYLRATASVERFGKSHPRQIFGGFDILRTSINISLSLHILAINNGRLHFPKAIEQNFYKRLLESEANIPE